MKTLLIYTTEYCHLCEQALQLVQAVENLPMQVKLIDIARPENSVLFEQFSTRIPVIQLDGKPTDLGWPFDSAGLMSYLTEE